MTNEELVIRIKAGETALMDELWTQVERFVYKQANKFFNAYKYRCSQIGLEVDDLYQEGFLAIHRAVKGFEPAKNVLFLTYASYRLKCQFFDVCKMHSTGWEKNTAYQTISLDEPIDSAENETTFVDLLADEADLETTVIEQVFNERLSQDLETAMTRLTERQAYIITERYSNELSLSEIARQVGVTKAVICKSHTSALANLKISKVMQAYKLSA